MKVVHLVSLDSGGAFRAAQRISDSLCAAGVDSQLLVLVKKHDESGAQSFFRSEMVRKIYMRLLYWHELTSKHRGLNGEIYQGRFGVNIESHPLVKQADVVHLHWVNSGFLSCGTIGSLMKRRSVVWTMHDMFAFTAGCYYDGGCERYSEDCRDCPKCADDADREYVCRLFDQKRACYAGGRMALVGCSRWMSECASRSALCGGMKIETIPNPVNASVFHPISKAEAAGRLGLRTDKKLLLFGAMAADSDPRKGYAHLEAALKRLPPEEYRAVIFGNSEPVDRIAGLETVALGRIDDDARLACAYSAADVFVAPSVQENLSNTVMEALACGTPVAAFSVGGMPDMIIPGVNGYLAQPFSPEDLAEGIRMGAVGACAERDRIAQEVHRKFSYERVAEQYAALYRELTEREARTDG